MLSKIFLFFLVFISFFWFTFASQTEVKTSELSIKELKNNIIELKKEEINLNQKTKQFIEENKWLKNFFLENLNSDDNSKINSVISDYNSEKSKLEELLSTKDSVKEQDEIKKDILLLKKDVYKSLLIYVKKDKLDDYMDFIKQDVIFSKDKKDIKIALSENEQALAEKMSNIKEKIKENNNSLETKIEKLIREKITVKLTKIVESEKFQKLEQVQKEKILNSLLSSIVKNRIALEKSEDKVSQKKVELYKIVEEILMKFISEIK